MKQKGFAVVSVLVGVFIGIILLVVGGVVIMQTFFVKPPFMPSLPVNSQASPVSIPQPSSVPDETANWKTYIASDKSFSISYPPSWKICDLGHSHTVNNTAELPRTQKVFDCDTNKTYSESKALFRVYNPETMKDYKNFPSGDTLKIPTEQLIVEETVGAKAVKDHLGLTKQLQSSDTRLSARITIINGLQAVESIDLGGWGPSISVSNGKDVVITIDVMGSGTSDQILSTFKFTDQNQAIKENPTQEELLGFPVYPDAIFIGKHPAVPCKNGEEDNGFSVCNAVVYSWKTLDDYDKVMAWYGQTGTGWLCGGAGTYSGPRDASGGGNTCKNNNRRFGTFFDATAQETKIDFALYP